MKKFKLLISALVFCAAALSLNSCIKDDNKTKELTPEEISTAFNSVKGDYSGKAITRISTGVNDTVPISWEIENDSLLTIKNIPANMMSYQITNEEIKKALASMKKLQYVTAIEIYVALQAIDFLKPLSPSPVLGKLYDFVRRTVPFVDNDRYLYPDIAYITDRVRDCSFIDLVENEIGALEF